MDPMNKNPAERDHEAQRCAWAVGWFLSLLKARRRSSTPELERAATGLEALGIRVLFEEDQQVPGSEERPEAPGEDHNDPR